VPQLTHVEVRPTPGRLDDRDTPFGLQVRFVGRRVLVSLFGWFELRLAHRGDAR